MCPKYKAQFADETYEVEVNKLDEGGVVIVKIGDQSFTMKPARNEDGTWTVNDRSSDHSVEVLGRTGSKITVDLEGEEYDLEWERLKKASSSTASSSGSVATNKEPGGVYPPMPGKITEVNVAANDPVEKGDTLCILEAMKMFNELKAPKSGTVKEVNVEPGSSVVPSDLLILVE